MDDLISRQAAIEALKNQMSDWNDLYNISVKRSIVILEQLPSAQPEINEWCTDCKEYDSEKHHCPRYNRVIREALNGAEPRKPGRWIPMFEGRYKAGAYWFMCSNCQHVVPGGLQSCKFYCESCGADMKI